MIEIGGAAALIARGAAIIRDWGTRPRNAGTSGVFGHGPAVRPRNQGLKYGSEPNGDALYALVRSASPKTEREGDAARMVTPKEVLALARESGTEIVDLRFSDLPGLMQHFSIPMHELSEERVSRKASASTAPRSAGSRNPGRHAPGAGPGHRVPGSVHTPHDVEPPLLREGPGHR